MIECPFCRDIIDPEVKFFHIPMCYYKDCVEKGILILYTCEQHKGLMPHICMTTPPPAPSSPSSSSSSSPPSKPADLRARKPEDNPLLKVPPTPTQMQGQSCFLCNSKSENAINKMGKLLVGSYFSFRICKLGEMTDAYTKIVIKTRFDEWAEQVRESNNSPLDHLGQSSSQNEEDSYITEKIHECDGFKTDTVVDVCKVQCDSVFHFISKEGHHHYFCCASHFLRYICRHHIHAGKKLANSPTQKKGNPYPPSSSKQTANKSNETKKVIEIEGENELEGSRTRAEAPEAQPAKENGKGRGKTGEKRKESEKSKGKEKGTEKEKEKEAEKEKRTEKEKEAPAKKTRTDVTK
eukprot:TRINITY_DN483_c0_g1_i4.p1 TRINITY_DN483_c0_g1~~TRINITY_DN483_c0_g1_i4.p1  ORF type:complete len:351 (-),score=89.01 TRINITY_DN483_c0_g1_i4:38-1090(-)